MTAQTTNEIKANQPSAKHSEITTHPFFSVLGVLLGALTSVFTGRLLSVGSADLQGALGYSSDYMSWLQTSFNASLMFIGPLTVYAGALLGPRRVLFAASVVFIVAELLTPIFGHNGVALVILQIIAGLAAGTYYPLTFTIIIRNFSLNWIHFGIAIYGLDILASTHLAHLFESFYITNLSWQWIFWSALISTPLMMLSVYFGIPPQPLPARNPSLDFTGFAYASCALTLIYVVLDQGERLDWLNSPLICAFLITGVFLLAVAVFSRKLKPNPMLNLSFLCAPDFLILGAVLIGFRTVILSTTLLVPNFLSVLQGYRPEQTAAALSPVSLVVLLTAPIGALLLYKVNSKILCAFGFFLVGLSCLHDARLDPSWTGETFIAGQCVAACGLTFGLIGLVCSLLRAALAAGALKAPMNILTISCWFQTCRLFGAEAGKTIFSRFLKVQGDLHYSVLSAHIDGGWQSAERLKAAAGHFSNGITSTGDPVATAATTLGAALKQQVTLLSLSDGFILIALICTATIVALAFVSNAPPLVSSEPSPSKT